MRITTRVGLVAVVAAALVSGRVLAQGCVAAHSNQRPINELVKVYDGSSPGGWSIHNLTIDIGYRVFNSNKYFIGDQEIARPTAVRNHQNIFDIGVEYRFTPLWSFIADVPVFEPNGPTPPRLFSQIITSVPSGWPPVVGVELNQMS